jgi:hypothetical protein
MLVQSAQASIHFVAQPVATRMYLLPNNLFASLIGPIKSTPQFWKGSLGNVVTNLAKIWVNKLPILWH